MKQPTIDILLLLMATATESVTRDLYLNLSVFVKFFKSRFGYSIRVCPPLRVGWLLGVRNRVFPLIQFYMLCILIQIFPRLFL